MIQLYHVSKKFEGNVPALRDVTLTIEKGEFVFINGPSGAGKSTLLNIIFGIEEVTGGHIIIDGRNYVRIPKEEIPHLRRRMSFVFQDFKLLPEKSVFDNVAMALKITGTNPLEIKKRVTTVLNYVKLNHRANFKPRALSGGEQQRVALARALVKEPAILIADEPTGNLDHELSIEMIELFKEINHRGTTVIIATHDMELIDRYAKRVIYLEGGRVLRDV